MGRARGGVERSGEVHSLDGKVWSSCGKMGMVRGGVKRNREVPRFDGKG